MRSLFVDTSAWYAIADAGHPHHARLAAALREAVGAGATVVTTNLVMAETYVLLRRRAGARPALTFLAAVERPPNVVVYATPELHAQARRHWLERFADQVFSLTDAVSFAVMAREGIQAALTLGANFAAAGFAVVPGS